MFTKEKADENRAIYARAKELLGDATGVANDYPKVMAQLTDEFPGIVEDRIAHQMAKVLRTNRGADYRSQKIKTSPAKRGPKPAPDEEKRGKENIYFARITKKRANALLAMYYSHFDKDARQNPGWGHVVDGAIDLLHHLAVDQGLDIAELLDALDTGKEIKVSWKENL